MCCQPSSCVLRSDTQDVAPECSAKCSTATPREREIFAFTGAQSSPLRYKLAYLSSRTLGWHLGVEVSNTKNYLSFEFSVILCDFNTFYSKFPSVTSKKKESLQKGFASLANQVSWPKQSPTDSQQLEGFSTWLTIKTCKALDM